MKKIVSLFILIAIMAIIATFFIAATHTKDPHRIGVPVNTTLFWGKDSFGQNSRTDTMIFRRRTFSLSGESTLVFVAGLTTSGILVPTIVNCSTITVYASTVAADSTKTFWYLIFNKK